MVILCFYFFFKKSFPIQGLGSTPTPDHRPPTFLKNLYRSPTYLYRLPRKWRFNKCSGLLLNNAGCICNLGIMM